MDDAKTPVVFISHALDDNPEELKLLHAFEEGLRAALREEFGTEVKVESDIHGMKGGTSWPDWWPQQIDFPAALIPVLTPEYYSSRACLEDLLVFLPASYPDEPLRWPIIPIRWQEGIPSGASDRAKLLEQFQPWDWSKLKRARPGSTRWQSAMTDFASTLRLSLKARLPVQDSHLAASPDRKDNLVNRASEMDSLRGTKIRFLADGGEITAEVTTSPSLMGRYTMRCFGGGTVRERRMLASHAGPFPTMGTRRHTVPKPWDGQVVHVSASVDGTRADDPGWMTLTFLQNNEQLSYVSKRFEGEDIFEATLTLIPSTDRSGHENSQLDPEVSIAAQQGILGGGLSAHIERDRWTVDDALGYKAYSYAIAKFLRHKETKPPLTVSIQAPWGGGKSSLMRMIQKEIDPNGFERAARQAGDEVSDTDSAGADDQAKPAAAQKPEQAEPEKQPQEEKPLTVGSLLTRWAADQHGDERAFEIPEDELASEQCLTVWFNVWKYQSTEQVWGGLADAIIRHYAERLSRVEREMFWLHLRWKRRDAGKIREAIHDKVASLLWKRRGWIAATLGAGLSGLAGLVRSIATVAGAAPVGGETVAIAIGSLAALGVAVKSLGAWVGANEQPANVTLGDFVTAPDYSKSLGFVHYVDEDLRRVIDLTRGKCRSIVIFVDDLDRCSPEKVADVVEAINLFLAGEFPRCMFVLGMDSEMVAAALEEAHSKVIAKLPCDATSTPIGWRFMDKFVQLPFAIPPPDKDELMRYAESLLAQRFKTVEAVPVEAAERIERAKEEVQVLNTVADVSALVDSLADEHGVPLEQRRALKDIWAWNVTQRNMDEGIESFDDRESEIRQQVRDNAQQFSRNPRELKRFVNIFRFLFFIRWARLGQDKHAPSLDQLSRWIVLYMKWPQVVRWIRRSYSGRNDKVKTADQPARSRPGGGTRLELLEQIGAQRRTQATWLKAAASQLKLEPKTAPWIADHELYAFFREEGRRDAAERLSAAEGLGLW